MQTINSTLKHWPGSIVLGDYLTFNELMQWQETIQQAKSESDDKEYGTSAFYYSLIPAILRIVKEWHIEGLPEVLTEESFPGSLPLTAWVTERITDLVNQTNEIDPN